MTKIIKTIFLILIISISLYATPVVVSGGPENDCESWIARINDGRLWEMEFILTKQYKGYTSTKLIVNH